MGRVKSERNFGSCLANPRTERTCVRRVRHSVHKDHVIGGVEGERECATLNRIEIRNTSTREVILGDCVPLLPIYIFLYVFFSS